MESGQQLSHLVQAEGDWLHFAVVRLAADSSNPQLAEDAVGCVVRALQAGNELSPIGRTFVSDFLARHAIQFAREQLGARKMGRPGVIISEGISADTFRLAIECCRTERRALELAYDAYFARLGPQKNGELRTFAHGQQADYRLAPANPLTRQTLDERSPRCRSSIVGLVVG